MDFIKAFLTVFGSILLIIIVLILALYVLNSLFHKNKLRKIKKNDVKIKEYFKNVDRDSKLAIIDETPREVLVGDRIYLLKPLKYRQYTRLCIMFARVLQNMQDLELDIEKLDERIGDIVEANEHDFFRAIAMMLFFSEQPYEENDTKVMKGVEETYNFLKDNATITQISKILEIVSLQNDIQRSLKSFGILNQSKKKLVTSV